MNIKEIKELIEIVEASSLSEFSLKEGNLKINMKKGGAVSEAGTTVVREISQPAVQEAEPEEDSYIMSPMVGTFYSSPAPDAVSYVNVGDTVKKGQILCIIEAMKLMNEIECEYDAEIISVMVSNEQKVEYGQPLFKVKKI
ncbi:MAG: acetyl-CoA carboxylase biotin carboxyl carrier protein [Lachnospiraceae bacterium]|nr:acetyl-CoA carboxylase biotin carboxyl carrier protein [Lachnospiraceae bacterium]